MSELLGRQDYIKNLRKDLVDIQGAVLDVFARTGPVYFSSWKFPDKLACNLDIVALLEEYDYVDGENDFNQHSHVVLLELVIDRFLLLLKSFNAFIEQPNCVRIRKQVQHKGGNSVGLVVRKYWSDLLQLVDKKDPSIQMGKLARRYYSETKFSSNSLTGSSSSSGSRSSSNSFCYVPQENKPPTNPAPTQASNKVDSYHKSCQTLQSSFTPCEGCEQLQFLLRQTANTLVELLLREGLPSSLQNFLPFMDETAERGHLTVGDFTQWATEQLRDIQKLGKHIHDVRQIIEPLQHKLGATETKHEDMQSQLEAGQREFKDELEKCHAKISQLELSLHEAQIRAKEQEERLLEEKEDLKREALFLENSKVDLRQRMMTQKETLRTLEYERNVLQDKLNGVEADQEECRRLHRRTLKLEKHISATQLLLDKERAKYESACRQQESMEKKQVSLLKKVDDLDKECDDLKRHLGMGEEKELRLRSELQKMSDAKKELQSKINQQQSLYEEQLKEKEKLKKDAESMKKQVTDLTDRVRALEEREKLLVAFPDLNNWTQAKTTGNVLLDMEQQLQANKIRVDVLEQENNILQKSLQKLLQSAPDKASTSYSSRA